MNEFQTKAINAARTVLLNELHCSADRLEPSDMYVVWFCKTLQNWKALVSGVYIKSMSKLHITEIGKKHMLMCIKKACNQCLKDGGDEDC